SARNRADLERDQLVLRWAFESCGPGYAEPYAARGSDRRRSTSEARKLPGHYYPLGVSKEVSGEQAFEVYRYAYKQINKKYDHLAILAFVTNRDWREDDCWFCSELVAAC